MSEFFMARGEVMDGKPKRERDNVSEEFRRKIREAMGKQTDLARKTGIAQSTINEVIRGNHNVSFAQAVKIARALGLSLEYLADDEMKTPLAASGRGDIEEAILVMAEEMGYKEAARLLARGLKGLKGHPGTAEPSDLDDLGGG